jgi:hypothetical protein
MDLSKPLKKELRQLLGVGHVRLLAAELRGLDARFGAWKAGEIDAFELSQQIHVFHNGPQRELYVRFSTRGIETTMVSGLVVDGVLSEGDLSPELLEALTPEIDSIRSWRGEKVD